jgi:hypothetical protein
MIITTRSEGIDNISGYAMIKGSTHSVFDLASTASVHWLKTGDPVHENRTPDRDPRHHANQTE